MKIDLRKLTGSNTVSIPFSETLDLREETLYGAKPFQSPVQISGGGFERERRPAAERDDQKRFTLTSPAPAV